MSENLEAHHRKIFLALEIVVDEMSKKFMAKCNQQGRKIDFAALTELGEAIIKEVIEHRPKAYYEINDDNTLTISMKR